MHVIARGYGDEPLDRETAGSGDGVVYIVNPHVNRLVDNSDSAGVGFPAACVFNYTEGLWVELCSAWKSGNTQRLQALWSQATPINELVNV